ncbi:MAG TPA: AAA family ATPase [Candidatus Dormibacteraeota bacterium]
MSAAGHWDAPLIGREAEVEEITAAFQASASTAVLIAGAAGVGKSRLAAEVAQVLSAWGWTTANVIVTKAAAGVAYGPFAPLLPDVGTLGADGLHLMQGASAAIARRARDAGRFLLIVDDAHLLDDGSAALVHQLVQERTCGLIATIRTPDIAPDPITSLWKDGLALRVDVETLMHDEADALVTSSLGGPVAASALRWFWSVGAGNPMFIRELLIGAEESRSLYARDGIWFLRLPLPAPARLTDLIATRLASITPDTAEVVDLVAIGEPLGFDELLAIVGRTSIEDAERRGLVVVREEEGRAEIRMSHPMYSEILRQRIPRVRLSRLCLKLAEAAENTPMRRRDDVLRIGRWRLDAGVLGDPELLEEAARRARTGRDPGLAARFARAAMEAGGGVTAGVILGEVEFTAGRHEEAEKILAGLVAACRNDEERAAVAGARAYNLGTLVGDAVAAAAVVEEALSVIKEPGPRRRLLARQVIIEVWSGRLTAALRDAEELLKSGDGGAVRRGEYVSSIALALLGRTESAVASAHRARDSPGDADVRPESYLVGSLIAHVVGGRLFAADADAQLGMEAALETGDSESNATFSLLRGWVLIERGLLADAALSFREAAAINRELSDKPSLRWCLGGVAMAEAMAGNTGAAADSEAELASLPQHPTAALDPFLVARCQGWVLAAAGHLTEARARMRLAADAARTTDQHGAEAFLLHDLVRFGDADAAVPRLRELTDIVDGDLMPAFARHATARANGDWRGMADAARRFEELGALMLAAEAAHAAAVALGVEGDQRKAGAMTRESARLRTLCGPERSPLLVNADAAAELTKRELEIAVLASSGLTSRGIADRLHLSTRTVDNHLQHVYSKLGITTRSELERALL